MPEIPISEWHRVLLSSAPTPRQQALYQQYPTFCGYNCADQDPELLDAITLLALRAGSIENKPLILAPIAMESWVLQGIEALAVRIFQRCKSSPKLVKGYSLLFNKLLLTSRVLQLKGEPQHWVSLGFTASHPLPEWMAPKLLNLL